MRRSSFVRHNPSPKVRRDGVAGTARLSGQARTLLALMALWVFAVVLTALPAASQSAGLAMPTHATAKSYGDGWSCDIGYRQNGEICAEIIVPENAYETERSYGTGWECLHGFVAQDKTSCVAVAVPDGGFLDPSGERWHCLRGHLKVDDRCVKIVLPENAYLTDTSYGSVWACNRGFEAIGEACVAIKVPSNGYLNTSEYGKPWSCERGFFERGDECAAVEVPQNAFFDDDTYGNGWKCERGYQAVGAQCLKLDIPANAHLDRSGNSWECDRNFQRSKGLCVLKN